LPLLQKRERCVACHADQFEEIVTFDRFPVYMGVSTNADKKNDLYADMLWASCTNCGLVQLINLIDLEILYHKGHNPAIGKTWERHHRVLAEFIRRHSGQNILEIGGGNLKLANNVLEDNSELLSYDVCDKNEYAHRNSDDRIRFHKAFFSDSLSKDIKCDTVVHSHLLEHIYDPMSFLVEINQVLLLNQKMVFAVPDVGMLIEKKYTNSMNFEHTFYIDELIVANMLSTTGFIVDEIQRFNGDIMFIAASKARNVHEVPSLTGEPGRYAYSVINVKDFVNFHQNVINALNDVIKNRDAYVFGAHIFTQFLLSFGLNTEKIISVLDNDPGKIGHRLYGTDLHVTSPKELKDQNEPVVILRAAQYNDEIRKDIEENINEKVRFVTGE